MSWLIVHNVPGREYGYRAIIDRDGFTICDPSPMGEANAALIAAAPDLLAACEAALLRDDIASDELGEVIRNAVKQARGI